MTKHNQNSLPSYVKAIDNILVPGTRSYNIIKLRADGQTLDNIGSLYSITRERVRQIESIPKKAISDWFMSRSDELIGEISNKDTIDEEKAICIFGKDRWKIIKYVLKVSSKNNDFPLKYSDKMKTFYIGNTTMSDVLGQELLKLQTVNDIQCIEEITSALNKAGFQFWNNEKTKIALEENGYSVQCEKNIVFKNTITIADGILYLTSQDEYKDGLDIKDSEHVNVLLEKLNTYFNIKASPGKSFLTRIQEVLMLTGRGNYMNACFLEIGDTLIKEIDTYIKNMDELRIPYESLFKILNSDILKYSNIDNKYFLHGAIKELCKNKKLEYCRPARYYLFKKKAKKATSKDFFSQFNDFILEKGKPVSTQEAKAAFPDWPNSYFGYAMSYFDNLVKWDSNHYFNVGLISLSSKDVDYIENALNVCSQNKYNYTNAYIVLNYIKQDNPNMLKTMLISNYAQLFNAIKNIAENAGYACNRPHFSKDGSVSDVKDLIRKMIGNSKEVNKSDIVKELYESFGLKAGSVNAAIIAVLEDMDFVKTNYNTYEKRDQLNIKSQERVEIIRKAKNILKADGYIDKGNLIGFEDMNIWMLIEVVKDDNSFIIHGPINNPTIKAGKNIDS